MTKNTEKIEWQNSEYSTISVNLNEKYVDSNEKAIDLKTRIMNLNSGYTAVH